MSAVDMLLQSQVEYPWTDKLSVNGRCWYVVQVGVEFSCICYCARHQERGAQTKTVTEGIRLSSVWPAKVYVAGYVLLFIDALLWKFCYVAWMILL